MIKIFYISHKIEQALQAYQHSRLIADYRVVLRGNENLYAYIKGEEQREISNQIYEIFSDCEVEYLNDDDMEDSFYDDIFKKPKTLDIGPGRRRFDALLDAPEATNLLENSACPIITFYSYKGGMGRSTTLAAFAMHLAINDGLKVVVIDCDFEAPGFSNFFLKNPGEVNQKPGFIEYFFDKVTLGETAGESLEKYTWEVEKKYCGDGNIRIMPAGNLDTRIPTDDFLVNDLNHYLEGLSRVDFLESFIVQEFADLIRSIQKAFAPDVILIDSRTGFNDVMGVTAFHLSKFVIGFFRNDAQTLPGLHFFLQTVVKREDVEPIIINSILPQSLTLRRIIHNQFKEDVKKTVGNMSEAGLDFPVFPIGRNENLEILGTPSEQTDDLVDLIRAKDIRDYKDLFEFLSNRLNGLLNRKEDEFAINPAPAINIVNEDQTQSLDTTFIANSLMKAPMLDDINKASVKAKEKWMKEIKHKILSDVHEKLKAVNLYAENQNVEQDFDENKFFFRECMYDLFNLDKAIILGGKGTGKSYIYRALNVKKIANELKGRAKKSDRFDFIQMVDRQTRIIKVTKFGEQLRSYKDRFWLVYTWSILIQATRDQYQGFQSTVAMEDHFDIGDTETIKSKINEIIECEDAILAIEKDMNAFDAFLVSRGNGQKQYVTLIYDQLDEIVHPSLWNDWMPALIDFWRFKRYSRIFGKLFIRLDLFRQLVGITNINELENQAINFEWTQEEMFAYFFQLVLSEDVQDWFWAQMYLYKDYVPEFVKQIRPKYNKQNAIPLEKHLLEPLTVTFFGRQVDVNESTRMGDSYDWFYKNLQNADGTISIRPFIDLLKFSTEKAIKESNIESKPILANKYYTYKDNRKQAVLRHFDDLQKNEIGNKPLEYIFDFLNNTKEYKKMTLKKNDFENMLKLSLYENLKKEGMGNQTVESLTKLLTTNGIVRKNNNGQGDEFTFAYLYKSMLGLKGN